jgi:hypothetical protein
MTPPTREAALLSADAWPRASSVTAASTAAVRGVTFSTDAEAPQQGCRQDRLGVGGTTLNCRQPQEGRRHRQDAGDHQPSRADARDQGAAKGRQIEEDHRLRDQRSPGASRRVPELEFALKDDQIAGGAERPVQQHGGHVEGVELAGQEEREPEHRSAQSPLHRQQGRQQDSSGRHHHHFGA